MNQLTLAAAIDFSGIKLPFSIQDLIGSGSHLLIWIGAFILLGLAFSFAPMLIRVLVDAFYGYQIYKNDDRYSDEHWVGGKKPSNYNLARKSLRKSWEYRNE